MSFPLNYNAKLDSPEVERDYTQNQFSQAFSSIANKNQKQVFHSYGHNKLSFVNTPHTEMFSFAQSTFLSCSMLCLVHHTTHNVEETYFGPLPKKAIKLSTKKY